jgi:hypothetical protein
LLYNVGDKPVISEHGLLATIAYDFGGKRKPVYALEGSIAVAGSGEYCTASRIHVEILLSLLACRCQVLDEQHGFHHSLREDF